MAGEYDITRAFKRIENELMRSMVRNLERHKAEETKEGYNWEQWQAIQLRELERYRRDNAQKFGDDFTSINKQIRDLWRATKDDAQTKEEAKILEHIKKGDFKPSDIKNDITFFGVNDAKLSAMIDAANADFTRAEYAMLRKANDEYRQIIFDAQMYAASGAATYDKAVDMATHDFLKAGIQNITYKNGARHTMPDYARMAIRTGNKRAYLMGEGNAHDKYGIHTVRVNKRSNACPLCVGFLGRVLVDDVYSGGTAKEAAEKGVPTLSQAMAQGFLHPNCKDIYSLYIDGVSKPAEPWTQDEINNIVGDYNQEQEIQHADDMIDTYQRMAELSLDETNKQRYAERADMWRERKAEISAEPPKPTFTPAATKAEAEEYAKRFAKNVDYSGMSLANANTINEQLSVLTDKYPINQLEEIRTGGTGRAIMTASYNRLHISGKKLGKTLEEEMLNFNLNRAMIESNIRLMEEHWAGKNMPNKVRHDIDRLNEKLRFTRFGVHAPYDDHVKCVVTHEYGHILSDQYFGMFNQERANPNYRNNWQLRDTTNKWRDALRTARENGDIYKISQYANANVDEFFAECFAAREMGETLPDYIEELMTKVLENGIM